VDDKLTAISSSTVEQAEGVSRNTETLGTFREMFDKTFPTYLAMGMTYDEFYNKDHTLTIAYRKAFELQREQTNQDLWLQGAYVYEAISRVAPLLHPFAKRPKAEPYLDKPYPLYEEEKTENNVESKAVTDKGFAYMQAAMTRINNKFGKG
jgi:hypothetical protein